MLNKKIFDESCPEWNKIHNLRPYVSAETLSVPKRKLEWIKNSNENLYLESLDTRHIEGFRSSLSRTAVITDGLYRKGFAEYSQRGTSRISHFTFCDIDFFEDPNHPFFTKHQKHSLIFRAKITPNKDWFDGYLRQTGFEGGGWSHINKYSTLELAQERLFDIVSAGHRA